MNWTRFPLLEIPAEILKIPVYVSLDEWAINVFTKNTTLKRIHYDV
jgi:hypothetical protein